MRQEISCRKRQGFRGNEVAKFDSTYVRRVPRDVSSRSVNGLRTTVKCRARINATIQGAVGKSCELKKLLRMPPSFVKFHGFGNDYIVIEAKELTDVADLGKLCPSHLR